MQTCSSVWVGIFRSLKVFNIQNASSLKLTRKWRSQQPALSASPPSSKAKGISLGQSRGPPWAITWAPRGNHVGPHGQSRGPPGAISWAPRGNHVGPLGQSRGPPGEITWATWGNHVGPNEKFAVILIFVLCT